MTDDPLDERLAVELNRRAANPNLSPDWSRRVLLPAVASGIDSRPQPVMTSRWSAFAGLAGVALILLVLVVALPRMAPGPAATASASGSVTVLSAAEFASRFGAEELKGVTVLVDGRIRPYDGEGILYGNVCGQGFGLPAGPAPNYDCVLGRLDGITESVWIDSPYVALPASETSVAEAEGWSWRAPQPPIEGRLVLRVSEAGFIEYLGTVLASSSEPLGIADANLISIDSITSQDVMLVEGWLWSAERPDGQVQISIDCIWPASSPIPGLPNYYCQPHDAVVDYRHNTGNSATAPEPRLVVQRGAAVRHGGTVGEAPHIFALAPRLHGGDCEAEPPCWKWEVVARLSDEPVVVASTDPVAANMMTCGPAVDPEVSLIARSRPIVIDETGLVESCESIGPADGPNGGISVTNPDGDETVLIVRWSGNPCELASTFKFSALGSGYSLQGRRPDIGCIEPLWHHAMRIKLRQPVLANTVTAELHSSGVPFATPAPVEPTLTPRPPPFATPQIAPEPMACSEEEIHATVYDETGLVESCATVEPAADSAGPTNVTNPGGDLRLLHINWSNLTSPADAKFHLKRSAGGYTLEIERGTSCRLDDPSAACTPVLHRYAIRLALSAEIDADTIATMYVPAPSPRPTDPAVWPAWWELAPTERPTDSSTRLDVLVFELACANGVSPAGRLIGPDVEYDDLTITITFQVRPLPGDCPAAPGAPFTVELSEPLGERRLVDGGFASSDRLLEHDDGLLRVAPMRALDTAAARFAALLGDDACPETMSTPRAVDEGHLVDLVNELGTREGMLGDGLAWVGDFESAVIGLGGFELYQDRDRAWYMIAFAEQQEWLAEGVEAGDLVLADVTSVPISGGRSIWVPGRYHQTYGNADCHWESDDTPAGGPRADEQGLDFTLSISAPTASWTAGQAPAGFGATLAYSGPQDPISIVGSGSGFAFAYWARLDGAPSTPQLAVTADCKSYQMASGERLEVPMFPAPVISQSGQLALPPGIWRLTAFTGFTIGECGGQEVGLSASIIVRVR